MAKEKTPQETNLFEADPSEVEKLLLPVTIIRDPLHEDILVTDLERIIIDSPVFQRLRGIKQLGLSYLVYPGAEHTRFLHSLGVLHVCTWMIARCNETARTYAPKVKSAHPLPLEIGPYATLLARLVALVHDCAHVPFGHSLEREGRFLLKDEWQDPARVRKVFDGDNGLTQTITAFLEKRNFSPEWILQLIDDLKATLRADSREEVDELRYPCVHDLVSNTMCADLIDYVERDAFFCGLDEKFGKRFLSYMSVIAVKPRLKRGGSIEYRIVPESECAKKNWQAVFPSVSSLKGTTEDKTFCKVVLLGYRYNERDTTSHKRSVITEAIDLIRRRFNVADKVYYHHSKIKATTMLGQAFGSSGLKLEDIWDVPDQAVIRLLANPPKRDMAIETSDSTGRLTETERSRRRSVTLATKLERRHLFTPIYVAKYHPRDTSAPSKILWHPDTGALVRFSDPRKREELIDKLETILGLRMMDNVDVALGSVTFFCPAEQMNRKEFNMLVLTEPDNPLGRLEDSAHPLDKAEIAAIKESHSNLWRIEICVDPDVLDACDKRDDKLSSLKTQYLLAGVIEEAVGAKNELAAPGGTIDAENLIRELTVDAVANKYGIKLLDYVRREAIRLEFNSLEPDEREEQIRHYIVTRMKDSEAT